MYSPINSDQHTSTLEEEEAKLQKFTKTANRLQQHIHLHAQAKAEYIAQSRALDELVLDSLGETCKIADAERRRTNQLKTANERIDFLTKEVERYRSQCDQQDQVIIQLRGETNTLNKEISSLTQNNNKLRAEKDNLLLEKDQFSIKQQVLQDRLTENDELVTELRQRELELAEKLQAYQININKLNEDRKKRDLELIRCQQEFEKCLEEKEREMSQLAQSDKNRAISTLKANFLKEIEERDRKFLKLKKIYEDALNEAARETQRLYAESKQYYEECHRLKDGMEEFKRDCKSKMSHEVARKFADCIRTLNNIGGQAHSNIPSTMRPIENVAQRALNEIRRGQQNSGEK